MGLQETDHHVCLYKPDRSPLDPSSEWVDVLRLLCPAPPPPRIRFRTHWRLRIAFHVIGRRASNPRSKRHELGLYRVSDIASFLLPGE